MIKDKAKWLSMFIAVFLLTACASIHQEKIRSVIYVKNNKYGRHSFISYIDNNEHIKEIIRWTNENNAEIPKNKRGTVIPDGELIFCYEEIPQFPPDQDS